MAHVGRSVLLFDCLVIHCDHAMDRWIVVLSGSSRMRDNGRATTAHRSHR
jgi:hypothetical protein